MTTQIPLSNDTFNKKLRPLKILALGDSLTAGLGVNLNDAYPAQLQNELQKRGYAITVVNAGISGETSSGLAQRVNFSLKSDPDVVIVFTGGNDGLRGLAVSELEYNLQNILGQISSRNISIILFSMDMIGNYGEEYRRVFVSVYPRVADMYNVTYVPFPLEGIITNTTYVQADGIHPTAEGYTLMVENIIDDVAATVDNLP
jgi:acyl-CoA thioesterase-1